MSAADRCGAAIGDAQAYIHLNAGQGVAAVLALLGLGMLFNAWMHRWLEEGDEKIAAALEAANDESLAIATEVMAPYYRGTEAPEIPAQRVTNGEDLLVPLTSGPLCGKPVLGFHGGSSCSLFGGHPGPCFPGGDPR